MSRLTEALERARLNAGYNRGEDILLQDQPSTLEPVIPEADRPSDTALNGAVQPSDGWITEDVTSPSCDNGTIPDKLVAHPEVGAMVKDQYRKLAGSLERLQREQGAKTLMISSAVPSEGKTLTSANLAITLCRSYRRNVLLIDADLRHPNIHKVFEISAEPGLSQVLAVDYKGGLPLKRVMPGLSVLPAGLTMQDPITALSSDGMRRLLLEAAERFDWIVLDTPPVTMLPDAQLIRERVDAAILVVHAGVSPFPIVQRAVEALGSDRIVGVVMNQVVDADLSVAYGYYGRPAKDSYARRA